MYRYFTRGIYSGQKLGLLYIVQAMASIDYTVKSTLLTINAWIMRLM